MSKRALGVAVVALTACCVAAPPAQAAKKLKPLSQYAVTGVDAADLRAAGYDMREARAPRGRKGYLIVATAGQAADLAAKGASVRRLGGGRGARARTAQVAPPDPRTAPTHGYDVFRPWSLTPAPCPGHVRQPAQAAQGDLRRLPAGQPRLVTKHVYGRSLLGQELVAYRVTHARAQIPRQAQADGALQLHPARARVARRPRPTGGCSSTSSTTRTTAPRTSRGSCARPRSGSCRSSTSTATTTRSSRRTRASGARTCATTTATARSPRRRRRHQPQLADQVALRSRGRLRRLRRRRPTAAPHPRPSPRCAAYRRLMTRLRAKFQIDYHSYGELILYPEGWQVETQATDDPLFEALAGRDEANTGDQGPRPGRLRRAVHDQRRRHRRRATTRSARWPTRSSCPAGTAARSAAPTARTAAYTPGGFAFQDSDADIETEFQDNLQFALDLARSARTRTNRCRTSATPRRSSSRRPSRSPTATRRLVEVNAKKSLGARTVRWRVVGTGRRGARRLHEWKGGAALRRAGRLLPPHARDDP